MIRNPVTCRWGGKEWEGKSERYRVRDENETSTRGENKRYRVRGIEWEVESERYRIRERDIDTKKYKERTNQNIEGEIKKEGIERAKVDRKKE